MTRLSSILAIVLLLACAAPSRVLADEITISAQNARIESDFIHVVYKVTNTSGNALRRANFKCLIFDKKGELLAIDEDRAEQLAPNQTDYVKALVSPEGNLRAGLGKIECRALSVE